MRVETTTRSLVWVLCVLLTCACGDDDDDDTGGMSAPLLDGGYPPVPCPEDTPEFRFDLEADGEDGNIVARLVDADNVPPHQYENDWTVEFQTPDGEPIEDADLAMATPFMPVHGHDGFYPPDVAAVDDAPGQFHVDNLNLWMVGPWEVRLRVESESAGDDYIVFRVCIE